MSRKRKKTTEGTMSDFVQGRLSPGDALRFLDAIEHDPDASVDLDLHVEMLNLAHSEDARVFQERERFPLADGGSRIRTRTLWEHIVGGRRALVPVGVLLGVILAGVAFLTLSSNAANPFGDLAEIGDPAASFRMRGAGDADLLDASSRLMEGEAGEAALRFERYLRMYPTSEWVPWVEYAAGLSHLVNARRSVLGFGVRYDSDEVRHGLEHLDRVLESPSVSELKEDAHWYRAKGSLMLGDARSAEAHLELLLASPGSRTEPARALLSEIRAHHQ
jgi:hypothetical protein